MISSFPDNWSDLLYLDKPLDWKSFLDSELVPRKERFYQKTESLISSTSCSISFIASTLLIAHILRSHQGLSTTYHRLVFGLSFADILFSSAALGLSSLKVPQDVGYSWIPGARGNVDTCTTQGFLITVGLYMSIYYNSSICLLSNITNRMHTLPKSWSIGFMEFRLL